jgi:head-tail adaptor
MEIKIAAFSQCFNELEKGNIERWIDQSRKWADILAVYDDGSNDGSSDILKNECEIYIRGEKNDFRNELTHKNMLIKKIPRSVDWIVWLDFDDVLETDGVSRIRSFFVKAPGFVEGYMMRNVNLWRSENWERVDNLY